MTEQKRRSFSSDYTQGAHQSILDRLVATNFDYTPGYGLDPVCDAAREKIRIACDAPDAAVHFLVGGTQANATVIGAVLDSWKGVVSADSGHIATHEAGAIEVGGHKVLCIPQEDGKISAEAILALRKAWEADDNHDHVVEPGMVYLSQPTEFGTLYSLSELTAISDVCKASGMLLYVDGARLAYALASPENDVTMRDLARLTDAFYIGGTKCGALFGEAVVMGDPKLCPRFFTITKQQGAMVAKGRMLGIQFDCLFEDGLYERIGEPAVAAADAIRAALDAAGIEQPMRNSTNQVFALLTSAQVEAFQSTFDLGFWERIDDDHLVMRFATSWATTEDDLQVALDAIARVGSRS